MKTTIYIIIIAVLFGCLNQMPYGYYQFVRTIVTIGSISLAYLSYKQKQNVIIPFYLTLAVVFNPVIKFAFGRANWQTIDIWTIGIIFAIMCYDIYENLDAKTQAEKKVKVELAQEAEKERRRESERLRNKALSDQPKYCEEAMNDVLLTLDRLKKKLPEDVMAIKINNDA